MRMSDKGRALLMKREGVRLRAYVDSVGVLTIGVGHTSAAGPPNVTAGLVITAAQCDQIFSRDLIQYENAVNTACKRDLTQNQFDACVSLCYNIGAAGFARSTVVKRINMADFDGAADAFLMWNKPPEIIGRRKTEVAQFKTPYSGTAVAPPPDVPPVVAKPAPPPPIKSTTGAVIVAGGSTAAAGAKAGFTPLQVFIAVAVVVAVVIAGFMLFHKSKKV